MTFGELMELMEADEKEQAYCFAFLLMIRGIR